MSSCPDTTLKPERSVISSDRRGVVRRTVTIKLPIQCVVDDHRWFAAITTRPALIADLGLDARQFGQTCNAVRAARLALIEKIIVKLPIAIHLATVFPCLADEVCLASVFPTPFTQRSPEPGVEATRMDAQAATHRTHWEQQAMLGDERVSYFASLAKYAVAFFKMSRFNRRISASLSSPPEGCADLFFHA